MLTDTPSAAFDLDDCTVDDDLAPWAKKLIEEAGSYTEITPSSDGIRIIGTARGRPYDTTNTNAGRVFGNLPKGHTVISR